MTPTHAVSGFAALLALAVGATRVSAEKVDMPPNALAKTATHVVVGKVKAVYERTTSEGSYRYKRYVAEVEVSAVEKGEGLKAGELAYVRYWTVDDWIGPGPMPPGTSGHRGLPKEGETVRVYAARNAYDGFTPDNQDGGLNVIGANGFEKVPRQPK
jgi:hypothetical protein